MVTNDPSSWFCTPSTCVSDACEPPQIWQPASISKTTESTPPSKTRDQVDPSSGLTREELEIVKQLKVRDQQVRAHEQAHLAAAGSLAQGGPSFSYQTGPDGKRYATGGAFYAKQI